MHSLKKLTSATYLTFQLDEEIFAADVQNVHEVLDFTTITKIPAAPDFMRGIINLRGRVVPVVDMRLKFGMPETEQTQSTCIIVMDVGINKEKMIIGALADSVQDVLEFNSDQIEPPPRFGALSQTDFIQGIGKRDNRFIIILNFDRVFSSDEVVMLGSMGEVPQQPEEENLEDEKSDREEEGNNGS